MLDQTIVQEFLIESFENLEELDRELLQLEKQPESKDSISTVFRAIHTIKGTSSFLGFSQLEALTHKGESLLSRLRDGKVALTAQTTDALLEMVDAIREVLASIENTQSEGECDHSELIELLLRLQDPDAGHAQPILTVEQPTLEADLGASEIQDEVPSEDESDLQNRESGENGMETSNTPDDEDDDDASQYLATDAVKLDLHKSSPTTAEKSTLRIDVGLLDKIMDLVGELVLARNQIVLQSDAEKNPELAAKYQRLDHITSDLQESVVKTRMQPIGRIWNTVPRQVRDVATECGKQVRVDLKGEDTELDKSIIEAIKDPITHLVRNCIDHGLESPEGRKQANKPITGFLGLSARHESGQVVIEVADDGRGIDVAQIREQALQRELVTGEVADQMTDEQWFDMLFEPGFSTAEKVTNISGRGVGLDVVKTNIERLAGTIELKSKLGEGTTFFIKIPLTLAIIPALIVSEGSSCYAIPQANLIELVRLQADAVDQVVEQIYDARVFRLRGTLLPLVNLSDVLGTARDSSDDDTDADADSFENIVVVDTGQRQFGLVVGSIRDTQEIVIKPLGRRLRSLPVYSGATILGDGQVALIMDVGGIAQLLGLGTRGSRGESANTSKNEVRAADDTTDNLLVVECSNHRQAIGMSHVLRLEEFPFNSIERSDGRPVIQYRGEILRLVNLSHDPSQADDCVPSSVQVVVLTNGHEKLGYVVDKIVDIVSVSVHLQDADDSSRAIVVGDRVTDLIDVPLLLTNSTSR